MLEHPDITCALRTGYPRLAEEKEVLNDEDDELQESEFWGDECEDRDYEERRERELFGVE
jgi:hypothetical protein